jgi:UDP-glucose 4-epimerase
MSSADGKQIRRIVILGHSGFIGTHLMEAFADASVETSGLAFPEVDLTRADCRSQLSDTFDDGTAVVLCSAIKRQFGDTIESFRQNTAIIENVAAAIAERPIARVAFMSSAAVYGEETHNTSITEETPVNPTSYYGIAKFTGECLLRKAFSGPGSPSLVCFRPPLIYGPGDPGRTYGPSGFSAAVSEGQPVTLWGDGTELREFLYVKDACSMIRHLTLGSFSGTVNLVSGTSFSFVDVIDSLRKAASREIPVVRRDRTKNKADNAFEARLVRSLLPADFAHTPLDRGVALTLESCS